MSKAFHLSKRLTPRQLWMLANDPDWLDFLDLIAEHPSAYPTLIQWVHRVQQDGVYMVGGAPEPDAATEACHRVLFKAHIPHPPANRDINRVGEAFDPTIYPEQAQPDTHMEVSQEKRTLEPSDNPPYPTPNLDDQDMLEATEDDALNLFDSDDEYDEEYSSSPTVGFLPFPTRTVGKRWMRVGILIGVLLIVLLAAGILIGKTARHAESTNSNPHQVNQQAQAYQDCKTAYEQAIRSRKAWVKTVNQVDTETQPMEMTGISASELDTYHQALTDPLLTIRACDPSMQADDYHHQTQALRKVSRAYMLKNGKITKLLSIIRQAQTKLISEARNLAEQAKGNVQDQTILDRLNHAITEKQYAYLSELMRQVRESMQAKVHADQQSMLTKPTPGNNVPQAKPQSIRPPVVSQRPTPVSPHTPSVPDWHVPDPRDYSSMPGYDPSL